MNAKRILRHLFTPDWIVHRAFPRAALDGIEAVVKASEASHRGEIRFAIEAGLDLLPLLKEISPRERAVEVFSQLRVWDTAENSGVLIYVQLVDRDVEIVADRGISAKVGGQEWQAICLRMQDAFRARRYEQGVIEGIRQITVLLTRHFPPGANDADELPNQPVVL